MKKNGTSGRKALYFNLDIKDQYLAAKFLSKCGRKQSKYISIVITYFIDQFGLDIETISKEELTKFFEVLPIIERMNNRNQYEISNFNQKPILESRQAMQNPQKKKEEKLVAKRKIIKEKMTF